MNLSPQYSLKVMGSERISILIDQDRHGPIKTLENLRILFSAWASIQQGLIEVVLVGGDTMLINPAYIVAVSGPNNPGPIEKYFK